MKKITGPGILLIVVFAASLALLGLGAAKLLCIDRTLDTGAKRTQRLLSDARTAAEPGGAPSQGFDVDGFTAVGVLIFGGDVRTATPIYAGTGDAVLEQGIGQAEGTARLNTPGNAVLFGHRDSAFRRLQTLAQNDTLTVETLEGSAEYVVTRTYVTDPDDPHLYDAAEQAQLTMVTCYPFHFVGPAPERFVAIAQITDPSQTPQAGTAMDAPEPGRPPAAAIAPVYKLAPTPTPEPVYEIIVIG